jgi:hypothetical protein
MRKLMLSVCLGALLGAAPAPQAGPISLEAENGKPVKQGKKEWVKVTEPAGFSGTGAMKAVPNEDVLNEENFVAESPRIDFEVEFTAPGKYFVCVRGCGETFEDNSVHIGLDGKAVDSADKIAEFETEWTWTKDTKDGEDATLKIDAAGKRTLNVWMREDGFVIDRILLSTDPKFAPSGKGP